MRDASTKIQNATAADAIKVNKVIKLLNNTERVPNYNKESLKLKLFTDARFNNLPNGGSQAGQILFFSDSNINSFPLYWNSSKSKHVARSTLLQRFYRSQMVVM